MDVLWFPIDFLWFSLQLQPIYWFILRQKLAETLAWGPRPSATTLRCLSTNGFQATMVRGNLQETMFFDVFWICLAPSKCSEHKNLGAKRSKSSEIGSSRIQVTETAQSHLDAENGSLANWPGMYLQRWICANLTNQQELARCVILYSFSLRLHKTNLGMLRGKSLKQLDILSYHLFEYVILYSHVFPGFIAGSTYQFLTLWPEHQKIYSACPAPRFRSMLWLLSGLLHCSTCIFMIMVFRCFQYLFYTFHYFPHLSLCDWGSSWVIRCHPYSTHKTNATLLRKFRRVPIAVHSLLSGLAHATYEEHTNQ